MYWDVVEVRVEAKSILYVRFADGTSGRVRFAPEHLTGVFEPLKDETFFSRVFIDHGAVGWPGEIDLAPDAMYHQLKQHGEWVLR